MAAKPTGKARALPVSRLRPTHFCAFLRGRAFARPWKPALPLAVLRVCRYNSGEDFSEGAEAMIASQRSMYIMEQLAQKSVIDLKEIARALNASESTVRRDIERLERQGKLKRVLGGAELADMQDTSIAEWTMRQKHNLNAGAKRLVAARAAQFVRDGECVFIDGGTSMAPLIRLLCARPVRIVTNNHLVLREIVNPEAAILTLGGIYLPHFHMTVGPLAEGMLSNFHFDHAFISCSGVDVEKGMSYTSEIDTINIKRIAAEYAERTYLLIDASKLRFRAFCKCIPLDAFDHVLCNAVAANMQLPDNFVIVNEEV